MKRYCPCHPRNVARAAFEGRERQPCPVHEAHQDTEHPQGPRPGASTALNSPAITASAARAVGGTVRTPRNDGMAFDATMIEGS